MIDQDTIIKVILGVGSAGIAGLVTLVKVILTRGESRSEFIRDIARELREDVSALRTREKNLVDHIQELLKENQELMVDNTRLKTRVESLLGDVAQLNAVIERLEQRICELTG